MTDYPFDDDGCPGGIDDRRHVLERKRGHFTGEPYVECAECGYTEHYFECDACDNGQECELHTMKERVE